MRLLGALALVADPSRGIALCRLDQLDRLILDRSHCKPSNDMLHSYSSMLITNIEIGTINGEVVEVAINVVINSQWRVAAHGIGRHAGQRSCGGSQ